MGFQNEPGPRKRRRDRTLSLDESGQLSIDFMIGLSIFLITLIIAATMISGLLVGLQSRTIDYDAVAYRTGVILVEDPGEPNAKFKSSIINPYEQWDLIPRGQDSKDLISRFGLTFYKSTPRILSQHKINNLFDSGRYSPSEIRERIIFGSYPYRFNVTIKEIDGEPYHPQVGDTIGADSSYGYIRRVVLVKEQRADISMGTCFPDENGKFRVELDYQELMNIDGPPNYVGPQYWVEPLKEDITIKLNTIRAIDDPNKRAVLNSIRIEFEMQSSDVPQDLNADVPARFFYTTNPEEEYLFMGQRDPVSDPHSDFSAVETTFIAENSILLPGVGITKMYAVYEFDPETVINVHDETKNSYLYGSSPLPLQPAVLEVRVW